MDDAGDLWCGTLRNQSPDARPTSRIAGASRSRPVAEGWMSQPPLGSAISSPAAQGLPDGAEAAANAAKPSATAPAGCASVAEATTTFTAATTAVTLASR